MYDAATGDTQEGHEGLGYGDLADDVDVELSAQLCDIDEFEGTRGGNPGVVDEPVDAIGADSIGDRLSSLSNLVGVGHVQHHWRYAAGSEGLAIFFPSYAAENAKSHSGKVLGAGKPDTGGCAGYHYGAASSNVLCHGVLLRRVSPPLG